MSRHAPPETSADRVNGKCPVISGIENMVGHHKRPVIHKYMPMEIMQDEKPAKVESRAPERIWNPGIQVVIRIRGRIVGNHRRALRIIIIIDNLRVRNVIVCWCPCPFAGRLPRVLGSNRFPNHFYLIPVFLGDGFITVGVMDNPLLIDVLINDGTGRLATGGRLKRRLRDNTRSSDAQPKLGLQIPHCLQRLVLSHP
jgi:hypothetical protein